MELCWWGRVINCVDFMLNCIIACTRFTGARRILAPDTSVSGNTTAEMIRQYVQLVGQHCILVWENATLVYA